MDPLDFLTLARRLGEGRPGAECRSAVSRAYYGAFHVADAALRSYAVCLREDGDLHELLSACLSYSDDQELMRAGTALMALRRHRNEADYELRNLKAEGRGRAAKALELADEILTLFSDFAARPEPTRRPALDAMSRAVQRGDVMTGRERRGRQAREADRARRRR